MAAIRTVASNHGFHRCGVGGEPFGMHAQLAVSRIPTETGSVEMRNDQRATVLLLLALLKDRANNGCSDVHLDKHSEP